MQEFRSIVPAVLAAILVPVASAQWWGGAGQYYGVPSGGALYEGGAVLGGSPWQFGSPWAYGNPGGFIATGYGHGIIQGASTSGAIIQGPSGVIVAPPQSAGSIVF
ncbi:hypothetical protein GQ54DRAFT_308131 [Martensiomyces pterosporus]|nr:hypothetical protein GQ54DRAFT_308131 [Martensiomyces pterosporus]